VRAYALARERRRPLIHAVVLAVILIAAFASLFFSKSFTFEASTGVTIKGLSLPSIGAAPASEPVLVSPVLPDTVRREEVAPALEALANGGEVAGVAVELPVIVVAEAAPVLEPFSLYSVQSGDTAGAIAAANGIDLQSLLWANADLRDGDLVSPGQLLIIPAANGVLYDVRFGDTIGDIATRYSVGVEDIVGWAGNGIASADQVIEDALLFIPNGIAPAAILPAEQPPAVEVPVVALVAGVWANLQLL
jgi:LysM repeat protein